jgi:hypothetical protein
VTGVSAIHHSLRDVNTSTGDVRLLVQIRDFIDRAAMNPHPHTKLGMILKLLTDFQRAQDRRFRAVAKNQSAAIACGQTHQFAFLFCQTELLGSAHNLP